MWRSRLRTFSSKLLRASTPVVAMVLIGLIYFLGIRSERTGFVREVLDPGLKRITQPVLNAFGGRPPAVTQLQLAVNDTTWDRLSLLYTDARASSWIPQSAANAIAHCSIDERSSDALIALRPGRIDGTEEKRWPFRIVLQRADTVFRLRSFDLVPVKDGAPLRMWLMSQALADQGLPSMSLSFVEVRLNDRELGLYAMEERPDSVTLARWGRGKGPLLRFDDELRTALEDRPQTSFPTDPLPQQDWLAAPVVASLGSAQEGDVALQRLHRRNVEELNDLRAGRATVSEVFDVPSTACLFALCDALGGQSATEWWDLRFLVDSASSALIALPERGDAFAPITAIAPLLAGASVHFPSTRNGFRDRLFGDALFFRTYIAYLDTFSSVGWLEDLLRRMSDGYAVQERIVISEYPQSRPDASVFAHNRDVIRRTLRPPDLLLAYSQTSDAPKREIAIANVHALPVEITAFITGTDTILFAPPFLIWPREPEKPLTYTPIRIALPAGHQAQLSLVVNVLGVDEPRAVPVRNWSSFTAN